MDEFSVKNLLVLQYLKVVMHTYFKTHYLNKIPQEFDKLNRTWVSSIWNLFSLKYPEIFLTGVKTVIFIVPLYDQNLYILQIPQEFDRC